MRNGLQPRGMRSASPKLFARRRQRLTQPEIRGRNVVSIGDGLGCVDQLGSLVIPPEPVVCPGSSEAAMKLTDAFRF